MDLELPHATGCNLIERSAVGLVLRHAGSAPPAPHRWSKQDLSSIRSIERNTVLLAACAGATTGALIGSVEILFRDQLAFDGIGSLLDNWQHWSLYLAIAVLVSAVEILLLYWLVLRRAARIGMIAGLGLSSNAFEKVITLGLSRAALEMPNPRASIYGIDPYARVPNWQLAAYAVLYRLKIGATSFVLRIAMRRLLARAAVRTFIPFIAIPVFAVWNALVVGWVMREIRIRAAGPQAIEEIAEHLSEQASQLDRDARQLILQAVAESIVRARDAHPNFVLMLDRLLRDFELDSGQLELDWAGSRTRISELDQAAQRVLRRTTLTASVLNGRLRRQQCALLAEMHADAGLDFDTDALQALRKDFMRGQGFPQQRLDAISRPGGTGS